MKSKHFMHWFFGGENEQIDRNESSWELVKKLLLQLLQLWMWMKRTIKNKEAMYTMAAERWHLLHMCPINCANRQLWSFFNLCLNMLFIHSFIYLHFFWFPYQLWRFFVFPSISNTMNVNKPLSIFGIIHGSSAPDQKFEKRKRMLTEK